jgi:hypothetical protein
MLAQELVVGRTLSRRWPINSFDLSGFLNDLEVARGALLRLSLALRLVLLLAEKALWNPYRATFVHLSQIVLTRREFLG